MLKGKYASALLSANYRTAFWLIFSFGLLASNVMLANLVMTKDVREKTIVVPAVIERSFVIDGNTPSAEYYEMITNSFASKLLTYHKKNVRYQFDSVLRHVAPESYNDMKLKLDVEAGRVIRNGLVSTFHVVGAHVNGNEVVLNGILSGSIGSQLVSEKEKYFRFQYRFDNELRLVAFSEVKPAGGTGQGKAYVDIEKPEILMVDKQENTAEEGTGTVVEDESGENDARE